jgi:hypothetical protein
MDDALMATIIKLYVQPYYGAHIKRESATQNLHRKPGSFAPHKDLTRDNGKRTGNRDYFGIGIGIANRFEITTHGGLLRNPLVSYLRGVSNSHSLKLHTKGHGLRTFFGLRLNFNGRIRVI